MKNELMLKKLNEFIASRLNININEKTLFFCDIESLGITGSDLLSLMEELSVEYQLDMTEFRFGDYIEGDFTIHKLIDIIMFRNKKKKKFRVDHLLKVIERKKWFDPE